MAESSIYELPSDVCSSSYDTLSPDLSEIRVVLLGNSQSDQTEVVNFLLEIPVFNTKEEPDFQPIRGLLKDKEIVLVNSPDLLQPNISESKLTELIENCVRCSAPGPHVFLLVLQPKDFTEEDSLRLRRVLRLFGDRPFDHSLVLISTPRKYCSRFMNKCAINAPLKNVIRMCGYRFLWRKDLEHPELYARLVQIVKENHGGHVKYKAELGPKS